MSMTKLLALQRQARIFCTQHWSPIACFVGMSLFFHSIHYVFASLLLHILLSVKFSMEISTEYEIDTSEEAKSYREYYRLKVVGSCSRKNTLTYYEQNR